MARFDCESEKYDRGTCLARFGEWMFDEFSNTDEIDMVLYFENEAPCIKKFN